MRTVGISVLMEDTGEKARALQHWSDLGIIHAEADTDKKGRGRYREYAAEPYGGERVYALVAAALNKLRIPLGEMRSIVDVMRHHHGPPARGGAAAKNLFEVSFFGRALRGDGVVLALIGKIPHGTKDALNISFVSISDFMLSPPPKAFAAPAWTDTIAMIAGAMAEHEAAYCLNLSKVFAPLRGP